MTDKTDNPLLDLIDIADHEKYLTNSRTKIITSLLELAKTPSLVNAYYNHGKAHQITTIIDVLADRDLVIIECGPDSDSNRELLAAGSATCLSKFNDIDIRFQLHELRKARYRGQSVFAAPIPDSLLRLQRREFFRVPAPLIEPITCRFKTEEGDDLELPLADISIGGLGIIDAKQRYNGKVGTTLKAVTLTFPNGGGEMEVALEVRGVFMHSRMEGQREQRIGCSYIDLRHDQSSFIQRYVNRLQMQQQKLAR